MPCHVVFGSWMKDDCVRFVAQALSSSEKPISILRIFATEQVISGTAEVGAETAILFKCRSEKSHICAIRRTTELFGIWAGVELHENTHRTMIID